MKKSTKLKIKSILSYLKLLKFVHTLYFLKVLLILLRDKFLWEKIKEKVKLSDDEFGFVCNGHNGDTYVFCSFIEAFKKKYGGKITVVVKNSQYSIPKMFPAIDKIITFKKLPSFSFGDLYFSLSEPKKGFISLGYPYGYINIQIYHPYNWFDFFKFQLKLDLYSNQSKPVISYHLKEQSLKELKTLIGSNSFKKAIIISPYSYSSIFNLKELFWIELAKNLKELGYIVMTNASKREEVINGTIRINFDFQKLLSIAEEIGLFIGIRSGLFDIISSANCRKIILYPKLTYPFSEIKYKDMDILSKDKNVIQIEFDQNSSEFDLSSKIIEIVNQFDKNYS